MLINNNVNIVTVGVGDLKIAQSPKVIKTSLGSCVGVVLYDSIQKVGGMLHLMLPTVMTGEANRLNMLIPEFLY